MPPVFGKVPCLHVPFSVYNARCVKHLVFNFKERGKKMKTAYNGKILRVNLTTGEIIQEELDIDLAKKFIGGRGLGTKILLDEGVATVDPLSENNKLIFISGPMTGTNVPTGGRYMVVTKSPLNGMIASSNSGGVWGAKLKYAGWDAIIVEGRAEEPVYINIESRDFACKRILGENNGKFS